MKNGEENALKENGNRSQIEFIQTKAAFVSGIALFIALIIDAVGLFVPIPRQVDRTIAVVILVLFWVALATPRVDKWLMGAGVKQFGGFYGVWGIVYFVLEKMGMPSVAEKTGIDRVTSAVCWLLITITIICISICLLTGRKLKK